MHLNVTEKILEAINFKVDKPVKCIQMTIFLATKDRASYIDMFDVYGKQELVDLTYLESEKIFASLKKDFVFPGYVQSLTIYMDIDSVPRFLAEYYPLEKAEDK